MLDDFLNCSLNELGSHSVSRNVEFTDQADLLAHGPIISLILIILPGQGLRGSFYVGVFEIQFNCTTSPGEHFTKGAIHTVPKDGFYIQRFISIQFQSKHFTNSIVSYYFSLITLSLLLAHILGHWISLRKVDLCPGMIT